MLRIVLRALVAWLLANFVLVAVMLLSGDEPPNGLRWAILLACFAITIWAWPEPKER